jgi:hypothetical protein
MAWNMRNDPNVRIEMWKFFLDDHFTIMVWKPESGSLPKASYLPLILH